MHPRQPGPPGLSPGEYQRDAHLVVRLGALDAPPAALLEQREERREQVRQVRQQRVLALRAHLPREHVVRPEPLVRLEVPPKVRVVPVAARVVLEASWQHAPVSRIHARERTPDAPCATLSIAPLASISRLRRATYRPSSSSVSPRSFTRLRDSGANRSFSTAVCDVSASFIPAVAARTTGSVTSFPRALISCTPRDTISLGRGRARRERGGTHLQHVEAPAEVALRGADERGQRARVRAEALALADVAQPPHEEDVVRAREAHDARVRAELCERARVEVVADADDRAEQRARRLRVHFTTCAWRVGSRCQSATAVAAGDGGPFFFGLSYVSCMSFWINPADCTAVDVHYYCCCF